MNNEKMITATVGIAVAELYPRVMLGAGYGSSDLIAASAGGPQNVALEAGDRVTLLETLRVFASERLAAGVAGQELPDRVRGAARRARRSVDAALDT